MSASTSRRTPYVITQIRPDGVELVAKVRLRSDAYTIAEAVAANVPDWSTIRIGKPGEIVADYPGKVEGINPPRR